MKCTKKQNKLNKIMIKTISTVLSNTNITGKLIIYHCSINQSTRYISAPTSHHLSVSVCLVCREKLVYPLEKPTVLH